MQGDKSAIRKYAMKAIQDMLPLDEDTLSQMVDYAMSHLKTREDVNQHFINLLGESPDALEFITRFQEMMFKSSKQKLSSPSTSPASSYASSPAPQITKQQEPFAYREERISTENSLISSNSSPITSTNSSRNGSPSPGPSSAAKQSKSLRLVPGANGKSKLMVTRTVPSSETGHKGQRLSKKSGGTNTSDLVDLKPSTIVKNKQHDEFNKKSARKTLNDLRDLDSALAELEYKDIPNTTAIGSSSSTPDVDESQIRRSCNCMATRHPLFEMFPNCLNCGKIICVREGLQPCSFCGKDLLTNEERLQILNILQDEKDQLEGKKSIKDTVQQSSKANKKKAKITFSITNAGANNFKVQDQFFKKAERIRELELKKAEKEKEVEEERIKVQQELDYYKSLKGKDEELIKAQARLDTLLNFQDHGAERTKIIDRTSDFDAPIVTNLWASPMERALQLKRQQKMRRKIEEQERNRSGRGRRMMEMAIVDGKAQLREVTVDDEDGNLSSDEEINELSNEIGKMKMKDEALKATNVYNYEREMNKWEKPVYVSDNAPKTDKESEDINNDPIEEKENLPVPSTSRVQFGDDAQDEIFGLVGI